MESIRNLFPMVVMGIVILASLVLQIESIPDFFIVYCTMLFAMAVGAVLILLG